jgi:hypothetical protein
MSIYEGAYSRSNDRFLDIFFSIGISEGRKIRDLCDIAHEKGFFNKKHHGIEKIDKFHQLVMKTRELRGIKGDMLSQSAKE